MFCSLALPIWQVNFIQTNNWNQFDLSNSLTQAAASVKLNNEETSDSLSELTAAEYIDSHNEPPAYKIC